MTYPVEPYWISVDYNKPASYGPHEGIDLNVEGTSGNQDCGHPVKSVSRGRCVHLSFSDANYGRLVVIETEIRSRLYYARYCHLQGTGVVEGSIVNVGDTIGTIGSTGNSTACHLHFDILSRKPTNWRFYTKSITDWFVSPHWFIKEAQMADMYKGYDLENKDSMRVAVDILVRVQNGDLVNKEEVEQAYQRGFAAGKEQGSPPDVDLAGWSENGLSVTTVDGNTTVVKNYKKD